MGSDSNPGVEVLARPSVEATIGSMFLHPATVLTSRLLIKRFLPEDQARLAEILADRRVLMPLGIFARGVEERHAKQPASPSRELTLAIHVRTTGYLMGGIDVKDTYLSYFLDHACWGQGYGFEAVKGVCHHWPRRLGTSHLHAEVYRDNLASKLILEQVGFEFTGLIHGSTVRPALLRYRLQAGPFNPGRTDDASSLQ
jgi:RimJ/RimL family protein N-acetyltransferase